MQFQSVTFVAAISKHCYLNNIKFFLNWFQLSMCFFYVTFTFICIL